MGPTTNVLDMEYHCKREFFYLANHFQHLTNRILPQLFDFWNFRSRLVDAAEYHHHMLPNKLTNRPISNDKLALLFHLLIMCTRIGFQGFYSSHEPIPKAKQFKLENGIEAILARATYLDSHFKWYRSWYFNLFLFIISLV